MNDEESEDRLRWEIITPDAEWEHQALMRQALERVVLGMEPGGATVPPAPERVIRF